MNAEKWWKQTEVVSERDVKKFLD